MGRSRPAPPQKKAAAPAPPAPKPAAAPPAAKPPMQQHAPPQQQMPPPAHQGMPMGGMPMASSGPSFMGTMAASMAGSVAGHAISNAMFGRPGPSQEQVHQMPPPAPNQPCTGEFNMYAKCVEAQENTKCQWAWDEVAKCRSAAGL